MLKCLYFILLFQSLFSVAQNVYEYKTLTYDSTYNRRELLKFDDLKRSKLNWHFRFWTNDYVLDLKESPNGVSGAVFMLARELHNENVPNQVFLQSVSLDSGLTVKLKNTISIFLNKNIPTQDSISGWVHGMDGLGYGIEFYNGLVYSHKTYWQPSYFLHLKEAVILSEFIKVVESNITIEDVVTPFYQKIPFRTYTIDGWRMVTRCYTKSEIKAIKREKRKQARNKKE